MREAKCMLGQDGTEANVEESTSHRRVPVTLTPVTGDFGDRGTIILISNDNGGDAPMTLYGAWLPPALQATFPDSNPGTGDEGEDFRIEVRPDGEEEAYVATPVWVTGPEDKGWPPTHFPTMTARSKAGERQAQR